MEPNVLRVPVSRLTVTEHIRIFCDPANYPLEIILDQEPYLVHQYEVYNQLYQGIPFSIDSRLLLAFGTGAEDDELPEPKASCIVLDGFNTYARSGGIWRPARFRFAGRGPEVSQHVEGGYYSDADTPIKWETLLRFLRTFYPFRDRFALYLSPIPSMNFYSHLKSLSQEFRTVPSDQLEKLGRSNQQRMRVGDELVRRQVLGFRTK